MLERYKELAILLATNCQAGRDGSNPSASDNLTVAPSTCREAKMWACRKSGACPEQEQILRPYAAAWQQLLQPPSPFASWKQGDLVQQT